MCWKLEFNGSTKQAKNRVTRGKLILNVVGVFIVVIIGVMAAVIAYKALEWFPVYEGNDGVYNRLSAPNDGIINITSDQVARTCTNYPDTLFMANSLMYKCGGNPQAVALCVPMDQRCDGFDDCYDKSDERQCDSFCKRASRAGIRFTCGVVDTATNETVPTCMHTNYKCDGKIDCTGESKRHDEFACEDVFTVGSTNLKCSLDNDWVCGDNSQCIKSSSVCNGFEDCLDKSDESGCVYRGPWTTTTTAAPATALPTTAPPTTAAPTTAAPTTAAPTTAAPTTAAPTTAAPTTVGPGGPAGRR